MTTPGTDWWLMDVQRSFSHFPTGRLYFHKSFPDEGKRGGLRREMGWYRNLSVQGGEAEGMEGRSMNTVLLCPRARGARKQLKQGPSLKKGMRSSAVWQPQGPTGAHRGPQEHGGARTVFPEDAGGFHGRGNPYGGSYNERKDLANGYRLGRGCPM